MLLFRRARQRRIENLIERLDNKDLVKRYFFLLMGCFIVALAFNVFFKQYNIVCFGISGVSIVASHFGIPNVPFILVSNIILLVVSYYTLGWKKTKNAIVGSLIFPIFVFFTSYLVPYIHFDDVEMLVIAIFGGVLSGIGYGLIYKTNFNTGGTDIICEIIAKYTKISILGGKNDGKNLFGAD